MRCLIEVDGLPGLPRRVVVDPDRRRRVLACGTGWRGSRTVSRPRPGGRGSRRRLRTCAAAGRPSSSPPTGPGVRQTPEGWEGGAIRWGTGRRSRRTCGASNPNATATVTRPRSRSRCASRCIRLSTWPGELVVDPFAGIGSTLLAARQLGRQRRRGRDLRAVLRDRRHPALARLPRVRGCGMSGTGSEGQRVLLEGPAPVVPGHVEPLRPVPVHLPVPRRPGRALRPVEARGGPVVNQRARQDDPVWESIVDIATSIGAGARAIGRHPWVVLAVLELALVTVLLGPIAAVVLAVLVGLGFGVWRWRSPGVVRAAGVGPDGPARRRHGYRDAWPEVMAATRLTVKAGDGERPRAPSGGGRVRGVRRSVDGRAASPGRRPDGFADAAEAIAHALDVTACRVRLDRPGPVVRRAGSWRRPGRRRPRPAHVGRRVDLRAVPVGVTETGEPWVLPALGSHHLIVGMTGSGKSSIVWSFLRGLTPAIAAGTVRVTCLDPKGGMELAAGQPLFDRFATSFTDIALVLEELVDVMQARADRLRGVTRALEPDRRRAAAGRRGRRAGHAHRLPTRPEAARSDRQRPRAVVHPGPCGRGVRGRCGAGPAQGGRVDPRPVPHQDRPAPRATARRSTWSSVTAPAPPGPAATPSPPPRRVWRFVLVDGEVEPVRVRAAFVTDDDITDHGRPSSAAKKISADPVTAKHRRGPWTRDVRAAEQPPDELAAEHGLGPATFAEALDRLGSGSTTVGPSRSSAAVPARARCGCRARSPATASPRSTPPPNPTACC